MLGEDGNICGDIFKLLTSFLITKNFHITVRHRRTWQYYCQIRRWRTVIWEFFDSFFGSSGDSIVPSILQLEYN